MGVLEQDIQNQLDQLRSKLEQTRLTHRDTSFKFNREQKVLKRIVASLSQACQGENIQLNGYLSELRQAIEQQTDISSIIPRLAVLERMLKQQTLNMDKQSHHLDAQIKSSGEILLRVPGLPAKIKRDLRDLLSFSAAQPPSKVEQAMRLLALYERSVKIISANPQALNADLAGGADQELLASLSEELQNLITELDFDGEYGDLLTDIRAKLLSGVTTQSLLELTMDVLKLVIAGTHAERKGSEKFLDQVNTSLCNNIKSVNQNLEQSQSYQVHRAEMHVELSSLVGRSQSTLKEGTELAATKARLGPMLDELASLSERLTHAEQREQVLIERMQYTRSQMEALYEMTQDYRRRLDDQARRMQQDTLTNVYNRSAFNDRLEHEYHRWIRTQNNLRLVMLDIDKFKAINDSFGFMAGDKALRIIARTISKEVNETATVARFSGEEFVILLPDHSDNDSYQIIQQIQRNVSKLPFKFRDKSITITLTAASTCFKESDTPEIVLERAYRAMSDAKKYGPNQIAWK